MKKSLVTLAMSAFTTTLISLYPIVCWARGGGRVRSWSNEDWTFTIFCLTSFVGIFVWLFFHLKKEGEEKNKKN